MFCCKVGGDGHRVDLRWLHWDWGLLVFFFQAEDGIRDLVRSRGLGDVYKRQLQGEQTAGCQPALQGNEIWLDVENEDGRTRVTALSLIHI